MRASLASSGPLRQWRRQWLDHGASPQLSADAPSMPGLTPELLRSWRRSLDAGLSPMGRLAPPDNASGPELQRLRSRHHDMIRHALPVMDHLMGQVGQSLVVLADPLGVLMHTRGSTAFASKAERVALLPGASWHESWRGTNAIGTALAESQAVEIHGAEHYLDRHACLTCAAAPIASPTGELLGILDISGDPRGRLPHSLGLVTLAAGLIENSLMRAGASPHLLLQLHPTSEGLDSVDQALLAVSPDGWIVGANRRALALLGLQQRDIGGLALDRVLEARIGDLIALARGGQPRQLAPSSAAGEALHRPERLFVRVHAPACEPPLHAASAQATSRASAPPAPTAPAHPPDALAVLDSGDAAWREAARQGRRLIARQVPLLIAGESGVGKEVFARALHAVSPRAAGPFVPIHCAALPEGLIEAELFGYTGGAYTGASRQGATGRIRQAHGGTLFLDEIGDMPLALQARLLRVLQDREVQPLGSGAAVRVDFTLLCASHRDLQREVAQGRFREDLYYRIQGVTLTLPALRQRSDRIALAHSLVAQLQAEAGEEAQGETSVGLSPALQSALQRHPWPGNVRQMRSVLAAALALRDAHEPLLDLHHLPPAWLDEALAQPDSAAPHPPPGSEHVHAAASASPRTLRELSDQVMARALENARGNVSAAARQLGISRQTVYRWRAGGNA
ncbi:sigma-54-dependent Fis family transcriptional regulator [Amphibiibacter pelophylacis]|uniref:Sigma-54-dependent Fis family transcriptional regulator n=1 Tax=Amphibiibacter pelophylacis TaxID=1799477 RepID=A0ACC6P197_9BURK